MQNLYQLLGVPNLAEIDQCREAFQKRYGELLTSESPLAAIPRLQELKAAFELLSDPAAKAAYDRELQEFLAVVETRFEQAMRALEARRLDEAVAELRACIQIDPREPAYYEALGLALQLSGQLGDAVKIFLQGSALAPQEPRFHWYLADAFRSMHEDESAETHYLAAVEALTETLKTKPEDVDALELLADIYAKIGWYDEALDAFGKLLALFPYHAVYHRDLGALLYEMGQLEEAENHLRAALAESDRDPVIHLYLGLVFFQQRLLGQAIDALETSLELDPGQSAASTLLEKIREVKAAVGSTVEEIVRDATPDAFVEGEVKWYDREQGLGVLTCSEYPQVLLHFSALPPELVDGLQKGDLVRFGVVKDSSGLVAVQVSRLPGDEPIETMVGTVSHLDPGRRVGMIVTGDERTVMFSFDAVPAELAADLAVGLAVVFDIVGDRGLDDAVVHRAVNLRRRQKVPWKPPSAS